MVRWVGIGAVIAGVLLILTGVSARIYGDFRQQQAIRQYEATPAATVSNHVATVSQPAVAGIDTDVLGILSIPKIGLQAPIVEGAGLDHLNFAVGHMAGTAAIGRPGNCVIAGHRDFIYADFFSKLDQLQPGDDVVISTKSGDFRYRVYGQEIIDPTDFSVLQPTTDATLTLLTCTPKLHATHRLIVNARLLGG